MYLFKLNPSNGFSSTITYGETILTQNLPFALTNTAIAVTGAGRDGFILANNADNKRKTYVQAHIFLANKDANTFWLNWLVIGTSA